MRGAEIVRKYNSAMNKMFVLYRYCSEYSYDDIYLGVFRNESEAQEAKTSYIKYIDENGDPYKLQVYHTVDLEKDVRYESVPENQYDVDDDTKEVCVLFHELHGLGESFLELKYIADDLPKLKNVMKTYSKYENFPKTKAWLYSNMEVGRLYYENDMMLFKN